MIEHLWLWRHRAVEGIVKAWASTKSKWMESVAMWGGHRCSCL